MHVTLFSISLSRWQRNIAQQYARLNLEKEKKVSMATANLQMKVQGKK